GQDVGSIQYFPWAPSAPGAPDALKITAPWSTSDFTLGELHQALVPRQKQLLFLDGVDMVSATDDPIGTNGHFGGATHALVADNRKTDQLAGNISIDQLIANRINETIQSDGTVVPSPVTALPSLELFIPSAQQGGIVPVYAGPGEPIPLESDPRKVYD